MSLRQYLIFLFSIFIIFPASAEEVNSIDKKMQQTITECEKKADFESTHGSTALNIEASVVNNDCLEEKLYSLIKEYYPKHQLIIKKYEQLKEIFMSISDNIYLESKFCRERRDCMGIREIFPYSDYGGFLKQEIRRLEIIIEEE